jgi:hypothetical protein
MQCWFFVWAPPRHPKPKRTQTEASKTDASIKTDASGKRGALTGVKGKKS